MISKEFAKLIKMIKIIIVAFLIGLFIDAGATLHIFDKGTKDLSHIPHHFQHYRITKTGN